MVFKSIVTLGKGSKKIMEKFHIGSWPHPPPLLWKKNYFFFWNQTIFVKLSLTLNLSLSLRDRDRADTIVTLPHHPPSTTNFLSAFWVTYTQVWYIIGIVSSSPTDFHSEKIGLIRVNYEPLSVLGFINI